MSSPALTFSEKSPDAFRTISEVAAELEVPQHVLRFWESRFTQIKPVKRAGGRRYYRPDDVDLLRGIRALLYQDGLTIRGVQKILKDRGLRHVAMVGRGDAPAAFAAPVVVEKLVFVEKPTVVKKRPTHLRAVTDEMSLPFFDAPEQQAAPPVESAATRQAALQEAFARQEAEARTAEAKREAEEKRAAAKEAAAKAAAAAKQAAAQERARLQAVLTELQGLKAKLAAARR